MADAKPKGSGLKANPLVKKLVDDPCDVPPDSTLIAGYLGEGHGRDVWRVYSGPDLGEYLEFRDSDVLHHEVDDDAFGGKSFVWLKGSAKLRLTRVESHQIQADFLRGDFTRELLARTPGAITTALDVSPREATGKSDFWCTWKILGCTREMLYCTVRFNTEHRTEDYSCEKSIHDPCGQTGNPCTPACETAGPLCTIDCPSSLCET